MNRDRSGISGRGKGADQLLRRISALEDENLRLRTGEERFRAAFRLVPLFVTVQDLELRYRWAYNLPKPLSEADVLGKRAGDFLPAEDAREVEDLMRRAIAEGRVLRQTLGIGGTRGGPRRLLDLVVEPLRDDSGRIISLATVGLDVTEQETARRQVAEARAEVERANAAKGRFLAAASHDLRQPFQAMRLFQHILATRSVDAETRRVAAMLGDAMSIGEELLQVLLDISALEAGIVTPHVEDFALDPVILGIVDQYAPAAAAGNVLLRARPCGAVVRSDPVLLARALGHLVANAIRFTERGGVLIGCRPRERALALEVWDTGSGIAPEHLGSIFEAFTQLRNPERDRRQGLGVGLAIVDRIAGLLDHRIEVRSRPGRGSVFRVILPRIGARVPLPAPDAAPARPLVVVIDDEAMVLKALRLMLEEWGYDVLAAPSTSRAVHLLRRQRRVPRLVVADYALRGGDTGIDAIAAIRGRFAVEVPGIIISGDSRIAEPSSALGRLAFLRKPFHPERLHRAIDDLTRAA